MNIHTQTFAYALADDLLACYLAATQDNVTFQLILHSRRPDVVAMCEALNHYPNVAYFPYGDNRGVARSANDAVLYARKCGADVLININDDVQVAPGELDRMARAALTTPDCAYVTVMGYTERVHAHTSLGFSCVAWPMTFFERVGMFDENFYPFYFEDSDMRYRAKLLNMQAVTLPDIGTTHAGAKTLRTVPGEAEAFDAKFNPNLYYFSQKWGGSPEAEQYRYPFNDPSLSAFIGARERHNPYPGVSGARV